MKLQAPHSTQSAAKSAQSVDSKCAVYGVAKVDTRLQTTRRGLVSHELLVERGALFVASIDQRILGRFQVVLRARQVARAPRSVPVSST